MTPQAQTSERETWRIPSRQVPAPEVIWVNTYPDGRALGHESEEKARACADPTDDPQIAVEYVRADAEKIRALEARVDAWQSSVKCYLLGRFSDLPQHVAVDCVNRAMATLEESVAAIAATQSPRSEAGEDAGHG